MIDLLHMVITFPILGADLWTRFVIDVKNSELNNGLARIPSKPLMMDIVN